MIEILLVVAIIGILAAIVIVFLGSARDKAKISSYLTSMDSVRAGLEICEGETDYVAVDGAPGDLICDTDSPSDGVGNSGGRYPVLEKCPDITQFVVDHTSGWAVTTDQECSGCRVICTINGCTEVSGTDC